MNLYPITRHAAAMAAAAGSSLDGRAVEYQGFGLPWNALLPVVALYSHPWDGPLLLTLTGHELDAIPGRLYLSLVEPPEGCHVVIAAPAVSARFAEDARLSHPTGTVTFLEYPARGDQPMMLAHPDGWKTPPFTAVHPLAS